MQENTENDEIIWSSKIDTNNDIILIKSLKAVNEEIVIHKEILQNPEITALNQLKDDLKDDLNATNLSFIKKENEYKFKTILQLMNIIMEIGKKGLVIQRFKGLGEMNAEQLWETTLDPQNRTLLQVKIDDFDEADETFSTLMGNVVEPRREFIIDNALKVVNLDV